MCDESTHLHREPKIRWGYPCIFLQVGKFGHAIERAVELQGVEYGTVVFEPLAWWKPRGIKVILPRTVVKSGAAYPTVH
jgi:hypothetical protein